MPLAVPALVTVGAMSETEIANGSEPVPAELVAVIVTLKMPLEATSSEPEIKPVVVFTDKFVGNVPVTPNDVGKLLAAI